MDVDRLSVDDHCVARQSARNRFAEFPLPEVGPLGFCLQVGVVFRVRARGCLYPRQRLHGPNGSESLALFLAASAGQFLPVLGH